MDYSGNKFVYLLLARIVELESNQDQMLQKLIPERYALSIQIDTVFDNIKEIK